MFDEGTGVPLVVIPGLQGRWEWMRPALRALATRCRTISYSVRGRTFDELTAEVDGVLDRAGAPSAAVCGVSFGGMIAVRYAASHPQRIRFCAGHMLRIAAAPIVPARMAARITLRDEVDLRADCARVTAPTLVVSGEPDLDRVVPVGSTRQYVGLIRGATYVMMDRTGHLGLLTQPQRFARIVGEFVNAHHS